MTQTLEFLERNYDKRVRGPGPQGGPHPRGQQVGLEERDPRRQGGHICPRASAQQAVPGRPRWKQRRLGQDQGAGPTLAGDHKPRESEARRHPGKSQTRRLKGTREPGSHEGERQRTRPEAGCGKQPQQRRGPRERGDRGSDPSLPQRRPTFPRILQRPRGDCTRPPGAFCG